MATTEKTKAAMATEFLTARLEAEGVGEDGDVVAQLVKDLFEWYNRREEDLDLEDLDRLFTLAKEGRFHAWDCPTCDARCYFCEPEDWGHFQGVQNNDYTSYPVRSRGTYDQCDSCRMHMEKLPKGYNEGRSGM